MERKWKIHGDNDTAVIAYVQGDVSTTFLGLQNVGKITLEQLQAMEKTYPGQASMTEESEMFHIKAGELRKLIPDAGKGAVGFIPIELGAEEYMVLIAQQTTNEEIFELWWVHLYIE
jgi:hypothetical protein